MKTKIFTLSEESIAVIHEVMDERQIKSEVGALTYILTEYKKRQSLADEIVETFNETNKAWMERLRWATKTSEQNSQILLDAMNTILFKMGLDICVKVEDVQSPVIEQSTESLKKKIEHFKQKKDNRKRKNKE